MRNSAGRNICVGRIYVFPWPASHSHAHQNILKTRSWAETLPTWINSTKANKPKLPTLCFLLCVEIEIHGSQFTRCVFRILFSLINNGTVKCTNLFDLIEFVGKKNNRTQWVNVWCSVVGLSECVCVCVCMMWHMILFEENLYYILTICCNYCTLIDTRFCIIIVEPCCRDSFREEKRTLRVIKLLKYNAFLWCACYW